MGTRSTPNATDSTSSRTAQSSVLVQHHNVRRIDGVRELSDDDGRQQNGRRVRNELMDLPQKWRDHWEKWYKNWVQKELMNPREQNERQKLERK